MEPEDEGQSMIRPCERCGKEDVCYEFPMMGWSEWLCANCAAAAYRNEEAV